MKYLRTRYEYIYKKELRAASWSQDELEDIGPGLRTDFEIRQAQSEQAKRRLSFLNDRLKQTVMAQEDLQEVGTETEDFELDAKYYGYHPKSSLE